jgi:hypothetical protein
MPSGGKDWERAVETIDIDYFFGLADGETQHFHILIDAGRLELVRDSAEPPAEWTALGFLQCSHCPLDPARHPWCPVAVNLRDIVAPMAALVSFQPVQVEITTPERRLAMEVPAQRAISSVMGLVVATSACPHTAFLKPMARFHLPMASMEETVFRAVSTYLIAQYFRRLDGHPADESLAGLNQVYANLEILNGAMAKRLRSSIAARDAGINALIILNSFAQTVPMMVDDKLMALRPLFAPYLEAQGRPDIPPGCSDRA